MPDRTAPASVVERAEGIAPWWKREHTEQERIDGVIADLKMHHPHDTSRVCGQALNLIRDLLARASVSEGDTARAADAVLGALLREALKEVPRGEQLELYRCATGPDRWSPCNSALMRDPDADGESDATRALAESLSAALAAQERETT